MTDMERWWSSDAPWVHEVSEQEVPSGLTHPKESLLFHLDGRRMTSHDGLFSEFSRVCEFPDYFGRNWPALSDCLEDMLWFDETKRFLLVIHHWSDVLSESPRDREVLVRILGEVGSNWSRLGYEGEGSPSVAFNSVLVGS
ncbi:barstar family protein [Streptomyces sp. NPDC056269]|uniref:barstar family protein n=1 Tax=Streptomyces sp. NPDC056269 TaxID=3345768 RepID=UPI0035E03325